MQQFFEKFSGLTVLIVGDVMMDTYLWGTVERISPEAPVPIVSVNKKEHRLGGAANVALNIQSLGAKPIICSVIGNDQEGSQFLNLLADQSLTDEGILKIAGRPTTVKTRIIGHNQQILRVDSETDQAIPDEASAEILDRITSIIKREQIDALIFEDYDKGLLNERLIAQIIDLANQNSIITVVDPKKRNFLNYRQVTLFKPNFKELKEGLKVDIEPNNVDELNQAVNLLHKKITAELVLVTLSELGVYMSSPTAQRVLPAHIRTIADVSGAGDTVIATAALCLAAGLDVFKTAAVANLAGGLVCEQVGVVSINYDTLLREALKL